MLLELYILLRDLALLLKLCSCVRCLHILCTQPCFRTLELLIYAHSLCNFCFDSIMSTIILAISEYPWYHNLASDTAPIFIHSTQ